MTGGSGNTTELEKSPQCHSWALHKQSMIVTWAGLGIHGEGRRVLFCVGVWVYVCTDDRYDCEPEVNAFCFPPSFSALVLEEQSLIELPRQESPPRWAGQQAPGIHPAASTSSARVRIGLIQLTVFIMWELGIWTQFLVKHFTNWVRSSTVCLFVCFLETIPRLFLPFNSLTSRESQPNQHP